MSFKKILPHFIAIIVFLVTVVVLFLPHFQGKALQQGDIMQYRGASKEFSDYREETGERTNWTNSMFGGMPTYQISAVSDGNQLIVARKVLYGFMGGPAGYIFCGMLTFYLMMVLLGVSPWIAAAGAITVALATNNVILYKAGHVSKVGVIMYLPLIAAGVLLAFRTRYLLGGAVFALGMGLAILANHPQMLYYFGLTLPFLGVAEFVKHLRSKTLPVFFKAVGVLVIGLVLALGAGASNLLTTSEYLPQSIRGGAVLAQEPAAAAAAGDVGTKEGGLDWEYAMAWSNGFEDILATYSPLAAGGGSGQEVSKSSDFGRAMTRAGFQVPPKFGAPLYHGSLPFTEGPIYLGAVVFALFIFGLFAASTTASVWLGGGALLIVVLSMGKNLEGINHLLFDNLPLLNNFRTPNSALSVVTFLMVALGILGLYRWQVTRLEFPDLATKQLRNAGFTAAGLGLLVVILSFTLDFSLPTDAAQLSQFTGGQGDPNQLIGPLVATRASLFFSDAMRSLLFVGLTFGTLYLFWRNTISLVIVGIALAALGLADFVGVNQRYLTSSDYKPARVVANAIEPSPADQQILKDPDPYYRVLNLGRDLDKDAFTSYFHKSLGGYSAVKLRRYQDLIDGYLAPRNPNVINMLNTKYILVPGEGGVVAAQQNPGAFGNAWLVDRIETVSGADEAFAALGSTGDLKNTAIVEQETAPALAGLQVNGQGEILLTSYAPNALTYSFNSSEEQLAVFSEIWYGPDLGWEATIDGRPAELIRANYALRALRVPAGQHTIEMRFVPATFTLGRTISLICSVLILLAVIAAILYPYVRAGGGAGAENSKVATT